MVKHLRRGVKLLLLVAALAVAAGVVWLKQDVRSLEWARPTILAAMNPKNALYQIAYREASIDWRNWSQFGLIQVKDVTLAGADGAVFAKLPAVYVSVDPFGMLIGRHSLNTILLYKPKLFFTRDAQKILRLGLENDAATIPVSALMGGATENEVASGKMRLSSSLPFHRLVIDRASLRINDMVTNTTLTSSQATLKLSRSGVDMDASLSMPFMYNHVPGHMDAALRSFAATGAHVVNASLDHLPLELGCLLVTCADGVDAKGMVSGKLAISLDDGFEPLNADVNLTVENARLAAPTVFAEPLMLSRGLLQLQASEGLRHVTLSRLSLGLADTGFEVTGTGRRDRDGWYVDAQARATKPLDIARLYAYWPLPLAPQSRAWVIGSMKAGRGDNMTLKLTLTPPDFTAPVLPDGAIDAHVTAQDMTVEYLPGFPLMQQVNANVHFTGTTIAIDAKSGSSLTGTMLKHAVILFPDLNKTGTPIEIASTLQAPARDAATILALKYFPFAVPLRLDPATIGGDVDAELNLKFDAFSQDGKDPATVKKDAVDFSKVIYDISTNLHGVTQKNFLGKVDIAATNGALTANNDGMKFDGEVMLGGTTPVQVLVTQASGGDVALAAKGGIGRTQLLQLGAPDRGYFGDGAAMVDAQLLVKKDDVALQKIDLDVADMAVAIPELSWAKKRGVAGMFSLRALPDGESVRYQLDAKAGDLAIPAAILTLNAVQALVGVSAPAITTAHNHFALNYADGADGVTLALTGKRLDMADWIARPATAAKGKTGPLHDFPAMRFTLDLAELALDPKFVFSGVKGVMKCTQQRCESANFRARIGKNHVTATIEKKAGVRQLHIAASDAGDFLHALGATDRLYHGTFDVRGNYDDSKTPPLFAGRLLINDFTMKNAAVLGRILSIGSLTGLSNALTGSGIAFDKLAADIRAQRGVMVVQEGKANGTAMGITFAGDVDTNASALDLKGVVVPAYALNSLVGKIPLIGALAGGDGEGLIAFNYHVKGALADPDVSVNPLSALTPGFLRGIFGVFDAKEKKLPDVVESP